MPLFELGSLHHDYYLLNVRLPVDSKDEPRPQPINVGLGKVVDVWVAVSFDNVFILLMI